MNSLALFAIAFTIPAFAQTNIITTAAGGFTGDGGAATSAMVNYPRAVAVGADGSLYIADTNSHRVRRVGTDGKISTYAGNGTSGFSGDGGPAASAQLYSPAAVAIGSDGILYIADYNNNRIRRVTPDGQISTLTGTGPASFGGDGGPASSAQVSHPFGVAVGKDNSVFIADYENHRIRRVTTDGKISTFAGNGTGGSAGDGGLAPAAQLNYPRAMTMAADGTLYIADTYNHLIRRVGTDGKISTVVGTGVASTNCVFWNSISFLPNAWRSFT